jgi:hypothetical protein
MKLFQSVLLAAAAVSQCVHAFSISSAAAATPAKALSDNEPLAKVWTVSGATALTSLHLQTLGRVFVEYDASLATSDSATLATVVLSGNSTALLDAFEVINVEDNAEAIQLHMKNNNFEGQGFLLTRVTVANKQALQSLNVAWSSDTIVGDDVLVTNNATGSLSVSLTGSADVFVGSEDATWSVGMLSTSISGSGRVQVVAKSLSANEVALTIGGSGDLAVVTDEAKIKDTLVSAVAGSGDITFQSGNLEVYNLTTAIAGSGDVTYSEKGTCHDQTIALAGSGDVAAGSIVCVNTDVSLVGSGDVLVQTTGNLSVASIFGNDVKYYGATPSSISVSGLFNFRGSHKNTQKVVKEAKRNAYNIYDVEPVPKQTPVYVLVKTSASFFSDEPKIRYDLTLDTYDAESVEEFLDRQNSVFHAVAMNHVQNAMQMTMALQNTAQTMTAPHGFTLFAAVGGALVAVGVAAAKYKNHRERQQYQPLV